ncbi:TonB-dependent receptor domain-containing protein [Flavobacterium cellulosilyticum]|uniref:TonB-dependent receptor n=1 Tax=Flavobacterium cellulosilyticum TaxID=2541731 RepID=A0A4R5CFA7_9FLAO|nr:TonB-dependent receptor [Flavobacterium cellulosilyticum]TDD96973.1 TonB-dependent receptor [Flavobacterium cellulosilyticum]
MNLKLILLCLIGFVLSIQAQNPVNQSVSTGSGIIIGKIIDKKSNSPLSYVNVIVKLDNKIITGVITTDKGTFAIKNLALKNYSVEIQYIGYKTILKKVALSEENKSVDLNTIAIEEDATQLSEVEIVQERSIIEQKTDRKVINVGKDLLSAGATAAEILNNIPSVSIDQQTNEISLRGNSNVRILIDGKPSTISAAQLLQQIPSSSIKQIELITNPSAKYNPEGMSGMINIVLNKNSKVGFNGNLNGGITQGKTPKFNGSTDMNYRNGKFNLFGNYGLNSGKQTRNGFVQFLTPGQENNQSFNFDNRNTSNLLKMGFDFYLNDTNTFSIYTIQNSSFNKGNSLTSIVYPDPNKNIQQFSNNQKDNYNHTYNLNYKKKFKKEGHTLEFEANYSLGDNTENIVYSGFNNRINDTPNSNNSTLINLDYTNPLSETSKLELGLESRLEKTNNNFLENNVLNSNFNYDRKIYSGYATYSKQIGKWNLQAGARMEDYLANALFKNLNMNDTKYENNRFTIYPSGFASYIPNDKNSYNFSVSKRVDRPSISQISPILERSTPQIDFLGNPNLQPQYTNSFEVNYTRKTKIGSITSGIFYRQINNEITRTAIENPTSPDKIILSYNNLNDNKAFGVEISGNLDFTKWLSTNISFDAYNKTVKGYSDKDYIEVNNTAFNARIANTFKVSKALRFQLSGMYRGPDLSIQALAKPMWKIDAGSSITVLGGNGTITARVSDVFNSMHFAFERSEPKPINGEFKWESQTAFLGFNYRFGSGKNKAIQRKARENNETQSSGGF